MRYLLAWLLVVYAGMAHGFTPAPLKESSSVEINKRFLDMAQEMNSRNLRGGGVIEQNLTVSSAAYVSGNLRVGGTLEVDGASTFNETIEQTAGKDFYSDWGMVGRAVFVGTGTIVLMEGVNISSVSDHGTGIYSVNFSTPANSRYYSVSFGVEDGVDSTKCDLASSLEPTVNQFYIECVTTSSPGTHIDPDRIHISAMGRLSKP